jgi:hypothetical protein
MRILKTTNIRLAVSAVASILFLAANVVQGAVVINAVETGGDVVFTGAGTIDQTGWTLIPNSGDDFAFIDPDSVLLVGPTPAVPSARFTLPPNYAGPSDFGLDNQTFASSGSGDIFGLFFNSVQLVVPGGYVKNDPVSGTSTYAGQTFASLSMDVGSYTWSWSTANTADSITLNVVPEPSSIVLASCLLFGLGFARRR